MSSSPLVGLGLFVGMSSLGGCSFIDDFDKFHAEREAEAGDDSGTVPADSGPADTDAAAPVDATSASDGAGSVSADSGQPGVGDAKVGDSGSVVPGDAGYLGVCGDGTIDTARGETCDDRNLVSGDGCEPGTCTATPSPTCAGKVCSDGDPCTVDSCDLGSIACTYRVIDSDSDGYSPGTCSAGSMHMGGDCNDGNAAVGPTATEICDGIDNNCDSRREIDEGLVKLRCYPDLDGDGFPNLDGVGGLACQCPSGSIPVVNPEDRTKHDCWDDPVTRGADVHPGQTDYFEDGYGPGSRQMRSFDYDCDGKSTQRLSALPDACGGLLGLDCKAKVGYAQEVPNCGEGGDYTVCGMAGLNCSGMTETRKQSCR